MIDAWSGPTPTPQQFPANEPNGIRKLLDKIKALELQIKEAMSNLLGTAGIRLTQLGMTIDSSLTIGGSETVDGPLVVHGTADFDGATTIGGTLGVTGDATFSGDTSIGGNAAITGTLSLPSGIINNDALANPIQVQSIYLDVSNFAVTTSWVSLASSTITVPAGFTSALVTVTGQVGCYNPHTTGGSDGVGSDFLLCQPYVGAVTGNALGAQFPGSNWWGNAVTLLSTVLTGLTGGGTFSVGVQASVDYANMAAFAANEATLSGNILWFR